MSRLTISALTLALLGAATPLLAQDIRYDVAFPEAAHHEAHITLTLTGLPRTALALRMSRSSPGRYALHEFAKNVYAVEAVDGHGRALALTRPDPYQWNIVGHDGSVTVRYTLFGDRADGTYSQIDRTHAHLNIPATFMWARGLDARPIRVTFHPPEGTQWTAATQLFPTPEPFTFTAPNLQYFMDSPIDLADHMVREWTVTSGGRQVPIRMALHHLGTPAEADSFSAMAAKVVAQEIAVFGETPAYDVGSYTFIADYLPWASGDGMEHRNSTIVSANGSLARNMMRLLGTVSHEYFHSWNVERIRPRSLEPFNFERANMSGELWFAEGFTNYYGPLFIHRAGLTSFDDYLRQISGPINFVINSPARQFFSPVEMAMQAPFVDAATAIDPTNMGNTFISYYTWGSVVGIGLDLTLRTRFGKPLDGYMRLMWQKYGKPEIPYTLSDLETTLATYTGDRAFAREFFARYIRGRDVVDFATLLAPAGLVIRQASSVASLGPVRFTYDSTGATIDGYTTIGSPLYQAGLDDGDRITTLDGKPFTSDSVWTAIEASRKPGEQILVEYLSRGVSRNSSITLTNDPRLEIVSFETAGKPVTEAMRTFRAEWLGAK